MKYIRTFSEISSDDITLVGGKSASLGEMYNGLSEFNIRVPDGFSVTSEAYWYVLHNAGILDSIKNLISRIDTNDISSLAKNARQVRQLISEVTLPDDLINDLRQAYDALVTKYGQELSVAVRSSATAEDLPDASFAGQHDTFLNVKGIDSLLHHYKLCLASLFTDRAIVYRENKKFDHFKVALSVCVMNMVRSDNSSSGIMFTIDTESGFKDVVLINATLGLGESIVQGLVTPDEFYVHKPTFLDGYRSILKKSIGSKNIKIIYGQDGENLHQVETTRTEREHFSITDEDVMKLAEYAIHAEKYYSMKAGKRVPLDIEWAKDSTDQYIYLIQARPETVVSQAGGNILREYSLKQHSPVIATGRAAGNSIASGRARIIRSPGQLSEFQQGEILVADATSPDWGAVLKKASAVVTNSGGRTCHAAIVSRELGIPAVVGTNDATETITNGEIITVSCAEGETGKVYQGALEIDIHETDLDDAKKTNTKLMINLGNPQLAFKYSMLPCDGVGLARMEFIINEYIGIHPMALLHMDQLNDKAVIEKITQCVQQYSSPRRYFIDKLAEGIGMIAAAFYPRPVIVRMSDFKSNEYANLLGGSEFEPKENNPMLGLRGASRYMHPIYKDAFKLECEAVMKLRDEAGLRNIIIMIPFCRDLKQAEAVLNIMSDCNLVSGKNDLKIYVMCEIPNNVILIDAFLQLFDGISIGSNDLTQLVLGVDRDSELLASEFNERDPGVLAMIKMAIQGAQRSNKYSGICGQGPSDYPDMTSYLVKLGIESISVNPDTFLKLNKVVSEAEKNL